MILELNEDNFKNHVSEQEKILVFFYREKGCSFCDKMKPVVAEYAKDSVVGYYKLGNSPDSITSGLVDRFPTFVAYEKGLAVGKQEGAMSIEQLALTFTPEKLQAKSTQQQPVSILQAPLVQLLTEEANVIDQIAPLMTYLKEVRAEIRRRKKAVGLLKGKK
jgi:thiol-disulfide isomerase/thioredoxin